MNRKGKGEIVCEFIQDKATLTYVNYTFPLRLMSPKSHLSSHQSVYVITYGGGLLSTDIIELSIQIKDHCSFSLLSQASTKVYKRIHQDDYSKQHLLVQVGEDALMALLPEPITCFKNAAYRQRQQFNLKKSSSIIILDWLTCGRASRGEIWEFDHYFSENKIYIDDQLIIRDSWLLESNVQESLKTKLGVYQCYANLILVGSKLNQVVERIQQNEKLMKIYRSNDKKPLDIIWSSSLIDVDGISVGMMVRIGSLDTIGMRQFLIDTLNPIQHELGNLFSRI
ncbi:UreD urease accessory protein-domain-containing protein [Globomyces pollinis-pini]|nr:UreD urease accessory protein-domain-containing protein [Globomyces pollinis-pini]KAJ2994856.1 hypothetical protein HDV02_001268 [Globomyces sp. JEL0801]